VPPIAGSEALGIDGGDALREPPRTGICSILTTFRRPIPTRRIDVGRDSQVPVKGTPDIA
jgi:hypothetical protein